MKASGTLTRFLFLMRPKNSRFVPGLCKDLFHHRQLPSKRPYFTSKADNYREKVGETITLICQVENLGKFGPKAPK